MDSRAVTVREIYENIVIELTENSSLTDVLSLAGFVGKIEMNVAGDHRIKDVKFEYIVRVH